MPALALHLNPKPGQQVERDLDIRARDQLAHHLYHDGPTSHQRQCHQQGRQKLARNIATHLDWRVELQLGLANAQGRVAGLAEVVNLAAELAQGLHQVANRALVHARHAAQFKIAAQYCQCCRERPNRSAGVTHEQLCLLAGQAPAKAVDVDLITDLAHPAAELAQGGEHDTGVIRIKQIMQPGAALTQGRQQQHPV